MDEKRVTWFSFTYLSTSAMALNLVCHLAAGFGFGLLYFQGVWWNARMFAAGGQMAMTVALTLVRFALLGGLLTMASLESAPPLLAMTLGVLIARPMVMRRVQGARP